MGTSAVDGVLGFPNGIDVYTNHALIFAVIVIQIKLSMHEIGLFVLFSYVHNYSSLYNN